ncbi:mucin-19-like isoform X2 [Amphibalanus amphitrite]|uniref:mucin-19-like isoform X2 n=1 Tax=Amphibalanus amphitrite TaxID=1232801 RepID=UPI001C91F8CB|nr:mucin-19-like isoform X2 [Amphibalanus amphitrite]
MLSPPLRGRVAGSAEPRPPVYRRSTSLGVAAATQARARPSSMLTLSTGRSVLAPTVPRRDYDPSLTRALAALEVPGSNVPRVLQGRRLYTSGSSGALGSAGSTVNSSSAGSSAGMASEFGTLRRRSRQMDTGGLVRSRSGIFGELKEKSEVPLTRTRTAVFGGSRAGSVLREDHEGETRGAQRPPHRPLSAVLGDATVSRDGTLNTRSGVSPGKSSGGSRDGSAAGRGAPRRSASSASVVATIDESNRDSDRVLTKNSTALAAEGKQPVVMDPKVAETDKRVKAGSGRGETESYSKISAAAASKVTSGSITKEPTGTSQENTIKQSQIYAPESGADHDAKQARKEATPGTAPKPDTLVSKQCETTNNVPENRPSCSDETERSTAKQKGNVVSKGLGASQIEKPSGQTLTNYDEAMMLLGANSSHSRSPPAPEVPSLALTTPDKPKSQPLKETAQEPVERRSGLSSKTPEAHNDTEKSIQITVKHTDGAEHETKTTTKTKKVKKKKLTKTLPELDVEKEHLKGNASSKKEKSELLQIGCQNKPNEGAVTKRMEITDDINNNIYLKKSVAKTNSPISGTDASGQVSISDKEINKNIPASLDNAKAHNTYTQTAKPPEKTGATGSEIVAEINSSHEGLAHKPGKSEIPIVGTAESANVSIVNQASKLDEKKMEMLQHMTSNHQGEDLHSTQKRPGTSAKQADASKPVAPLSPPNAATSSSSVISTKGAKDVNAGKTTLHSTGSKEVADQIEAAGVRENSSKSIANEGAAKANSASMENNPISKHVEAKRLNTAMTCEDSLSAKILSGTDRRQKSPVQSESSSNTLTSPAVDSQRSEVTVTHAVSASHAARDAHSSDASDAGRMAATDSSPVTKPSDSTSSGGKSEQKQNTPVKHRDHTDRKSGLTDREKNVNRNAAVVGDRLIVGEMEGDVPCINGNGSTRKTRSKERKLLARSPCEKPVQSTAANEKQTKHNFVVERKANMNEASALAAKQSGFKTTKTLQETNAQALPQIKLGGGNDAEPAPVKKKVKIVRKKPPLISEPQQIKLTNVTPTNKLQFPVNTLSSMSPFLRADQEKNSKNSKPKTSVTALKQPVVSDSSVKQDESVGRSSGKPTKLQKKRVSKTPDGSKRSKNMEKVEARETSKTKRSVENVSTDVKGMPSDNLKPSLANSRSRAKRKTNTKKSSSSRLDTKKVKSSSEQSSSSESCSSSEYDSEEEISPLERAKREIREAKEREEARKIEKFRRRGQRAKLKMERLKMEDDPEGYMKVPGNLRFVFMIKQDDWMQKQKEEATKKEEEASHVDGAPPAGPVTSLRDGLTSSEAVRRPSAEIDESPFDRRLGPLGGPPPKFRQYALQDFRLLRVLGKGAFGKVMLARMKDTRNYFAIKCLRKDKIVNDEDVEDTLIERKILTLGTNHPYLCHLFCTFQSPSHLFFVLEFLNGGDLSFHLGQMGRFSNELARFYASELVCGLRFLHKRGIIYRDLKLDNVLLDHEGHVRIADFGMCQMQIFLDRTADAFCGTVDYMAPEVVSGKNYNQSVDWWSFGIMLYEMLVGLTPFIGLDEDELFWAIRTEEPYYPRFLEPDAKEIIKWLLVKDPALRLGSPECPAGGVCSQPFFRRVDWYLVERKQHDPPPFRPTLLTMADCRYFEDDYTTLPARLTDIPDDVLAEVRQDRFANFDYTNPNMTD